MLEGGAGSGYQSAVLARIAAKVFGIEIVEPLALEARQRMARLGYKSDSYGRIFSDKSHVGKTVDQDIQEYLRRSPISHVAKLKTPLLIHSTTNDEDVNVLEVRRLIAALKAEGKTFESKIYEDAPGGHHFNRIDTKLARESRAEIYKFLARYLKP